MPIRIKETTMKKILILTILTLVTISAAFAQIAGGKIAVRELTVEDRGETVAVKFNAVIDKKAVKRNHTLVFAPVIVNGTYRQSLPPVVVHGRGSAIARNRRDWVARSTSEYENAFYAGNGETVRIAATVPFQKWMLDSELMIEWVEGGCCNYSTLDNYILADNIVSREAPKTEIIIETPVVGWVPVTLADTLSTAFAFVAPLSEFDEENPLRIYDDERENALIIYYRVARYNIEPSYMDNSFSLANLTNVINMIVNASDSKVAKIVVGGFASPEGNYDFNDKLAFERAVSVKKHILETTRVKDSQVLVFNGSVDWRGLRAMIVKSNLPEKKEILSIIDNTPVWDSRRQVGRLGELMRLNGGSTYRYLLHEYFPYLRNGAFIKVYYENT